MRSRYHGTLEISAGHVAHDKAKCHSERSPDLFAKPLCSLATSPVTEPQMNTEDLKQQIRYTFFVSCLSVAHSRSDVVKADRWVLRKALEGIPVMSRIVISKNRFSPKIVPASDNLHGGELLPRRPFRGSALLLTGIAGVWK